MEISTTPQTPIDIDKQATAAQEKIDKRRMTSKANLEIARQAKLEMLKKQKEAKFEKKAEDIVHVRKIESDSESDSDSEEEIIYIAPEKKKKINEIEELRQMVKEMMAKTEQKVVYVQPAAPAPPPAPVQNEPPKPKQVRQPYYDVITGTLKERILNF